MQAQTHPATSPTQQIERVVTASLGRNPARSGLGLLWEPADETGILSVRLEPPRDGIHVLDVLLARAPDEFRFTLARAWELAANLVTRTDLTAIPAVPRQEAADGLRSIMTRLTLRDAPFDLPRLNRLTEALELLQQCARDIQAELPPVPGVVPDMPPELAGAADLLAARDLCDSNEGDVSADALRLLGSGLVVALVGSELRVRLELDRIARNAPNVALLNQATPIHQVPQVARIAKCSGIILGAPCGRLRPRTSPYEQGREIESMLKEMTASGLPLLTYGDREELEAVFGLGQGRRHSPLRPVIHDLPAARREDLAHAALDGSAAGTSASANDRLVAPILEAIDRGAPGRDELLQPLAALAADRGPDQPGLTDELASLAADLAERRDTFGTCEQAPAAPRSQDFSRRLRQRLGGPALLDLLQARIRGQEPALCELARRLRIEVMTRHDTEVIRMMLCGPVGTGKSVAVKYLAELLDLPHHYIDACSFDSEHAVKSSLAGAAPGIVNSYHDGVLARIARRASVVEVADLDHAQPGVRSALCDFFLRVLQEGTLQTGSGAVIRTVSSVLFLFTSNTAYGTQAAATPFGFTTFSRDQVRQRVMNRAAEQLGQAFVSRVGAPVLFDNFTRETAIEVAETEIIALVNRVTGAARVDTDPAIAARIIDAAPTLDTGARGVIDAARDLVSGALTDHWNLDAKHVRIRLNEGRVIVEAVNPSPPPGEAS
ncbi:MAG: hypothetical protein CMJ18_03220 [Phycisphaeraceae bacterium]|nr:hypothetical protein [Phycisphaeraceae bacterium]